jgi:hypothetical protein
MAGSFKNTGRQRISIVKQFKHFAKSKLKYNFIPYSNYTYAGYGRKTFQYSEDGLIGLYSIGLLTCYN